MSYLESEALCPYYIRDVAGIIKCEAVGNVECRDKQMFRDIGYGYCANRYKQCPFKVAMDGYYERNSTDECAADGDPRQIEFF